MRIAVCISGQPRTWRTAKDNILKYFDLPKCEVDFFIHTWDKNSFRLKTDINWTRTYDPVAADELDGIKEAFKPKLIEMEKYKDENFLSIWDSIYYSFMKSVWLKRKYELDNDFIYRRANVLPEWIAKWWIRRTSCCGRLTCGFEYPPKLFGAG